MLGVETWAVPGWLPTPGTLAEIGEVLLWTGAIAQTIFVVIWCTLPWWREWVGRAVMVKGMAIAIYLDSYLLHTHVLPDYDLEPYVRTGLFAVVVLGIVSQVIALAHEMWLARRQRRKVTGTDRHDSAGVRLP